jgi:hypothetical protein
MSAQKGTLFSGSKEKNVKELSAFQNNKTPVKALRGLSSEEQDAKVKTFYPQNDESLKSISRLEEANTVNLSRAHTILNDHLVQAGS